MKLTLEQFQEQLNRKSETRTMTVKGETHYLYEPQSVQVNLPDGTSRIYMIEKCDKDVCGNYGSISCTRFFKDGADGKSTTDKKSYKTYLTEQSFIKAIKRIVYITNLHNNK